jgi:hypothetical protein
MNSTQRRRRNRLAGAAAFATAGAADFPETSKGGQAASEILDILAEIDTHATSRESSISALQRDTVVKKDLREAIRAHLRAISDTARTIALDHPDIKGSFQFTGANVGDRTLLATARAFAAAAQPLKARFVEYDMSADFHDKFSADINNFEQHLNRQTADKGERVAANASLDDALNRGEAALERFDTAVRNKYRNDPAKVAAWESARHLERAHARNKRGGETPPTPQTHGGTGETK